MKIKRVIQNNLFMLSLLHKVCPSKIYFNILMTIWGCVLTIITDIVLVRTVIDQIQAGKAFLEVLLFIVGIFIFQILTELSISLYDNFYLPRVDIEINRKLQKVFYEKVVQLDLADIETTAFYDEYVRASVTLASKAHEVLRTVCDIISSVVLLFSMSTILFMIDPFLIIFAIAPFIYTLLMGNKLNKLRFDYQMEDTQLNRETEYIERTYYLTDYAKEMRLTNIINVLKKRYATLMKTKRDRIRKRFPKLTWFGYIGKFINNYIVGNGSMIYAAFKMIVMKSMVLGDFFVVTNSIGEVSGALNAFGGIFQAFNGHSLYIEQLRGFLEREPKVSRNENGPLASKSNIHIKLNSVYFKYNGTQEDCLKDVSLEIKPGEKIAIVGNNGAGKTTLVKLLMRLYDVDRGSIELNGVDIRNYNLDSYRDIFGTIFQDHKVISMTVKENILMCDEEPENSDEIIEDALKKSDIYEKIDQLPLKTETILSREFDENGTVLSGGEYQKIALARVFAKSCGIVILDEPSSALDPIAEYKMYNNMMEACKDKTVIFISHRLSSAVMADRIYLFEDGRITESGSHRELIALNKKYADMFNKQAEKYKGQEAVVEVI